MNLKKQIILVLSLFSVDFIIKQLILNIESLHSRTVIPNFFSLYFTKNFGISFSMFSNSKFLIILFSVCAIIFIVSLIKANKSKLFYQVPLLIILSGAIGNFFDRIIYGFVVDYLSFSFWGYDFAIFNLADMMIVCSAIFLVGYAWFIEKE